MPERDQLGSLQQPSQRQRQPETAAFSAPSLQLKALIDLAAGSSRAVQLKALSDAMRDSGRMVTQRKALSSYSGNGLPASRPATLASGADLLMPQPSLPKPATPSGQGGHIHLAPGQERHLPHEAWHVVQQAKGRVEPTMQAKGGTPINDDVGLESEADAMGAKALDVGRRQPAIGGATGSSNASPAPGITQLKGPGMRERIRTKMKNKELMTEREMAKARSYGMLDYDWNKRVKIDKAMNTRVAPPTVGISNRDARGEMDGAERAEEAEDALLGKRIICNNFPARLAPAGTNIFDIKRTDINAVKKVYFKGTLERLAGYGPFGVNDDSKAVHTMTAPKLFFSQDRRSQASVLPTTRFFVGGGKILNSNEHGINRKRQQLNTTNYILNAAGELHIPTTATTGHEVIADEQPVRLAGELITRGADYVSHDNKSGHYRPDLISLGP